MNNIVERTPLTSVDKHGRSIGTRFNLPTDLLTPLPTNDQRKQLREYFLSHLAALEKPEQLNILVFSGHHVRLTLNGKLWQDLVPICHECHKPAIQDNDLGAYVSLQERDNYPGVDRETGYKIDLGAPYVNVCRECFSKFWE